MSNLVGLSGDETPGLNTISDTDSDRDDWYEPTSASRNASGLHEELAQRLAVSASVIANLPVAGPTNRTTDQHWEERTEAPLQRPRPCKSLRWTQESSVGVVPHGELPDSSPSDSED